MGCRESGTCGPAGRERAMLLDPQGRPRITPWLKRAAQTVWLGRLKQSSGPGLRLRAWWVGSGGGVGRDFGESRAFKGGGADFLVICFSPFAALASL